MEAGASPLSGAVIGQFEIGELIAAGGMGEVYRAEDRRLGRSVAVKAMRPELHADATSRKRFVRESRLACRVVHPYVATVFDVVEHDEQVLLVMELIEGRPLGELLRERRPEPRVLVGWLLEVAEALVAIHRAGLVHRDIKPGNVLITADGHVKVTDFGLARRALPFEPAPDDTTHTLDSPITQQGTLLGTPLYMSPEQLRGEKIDARSDQFSLGVLAYEALGGTHPFARGTALESMSAILREPPSGGDRSPLLHEGVPLRRTLDVLLAKDRAARYADSDSMLRELRATARALDRAGAGRPPRARVLGAAALLAAVLGGAGWWWVRQPPAWDGPRFAVAVAPFEDRTGVESGAVRAGMVGDLLAADLQASRLVRAEGPSDLRFSGAWSADPVLGLSGTRKVDYVLAGTLYRDGEAWVATAEVRPMHDEAPALPALRASGATVLEVAERLAGRVRRELPRVSRLDALRDDRVDLAEITSSSDEARLEYATGMAALREDRLLDAIAAFEGATATDEAFTLAFVRLAEALDRAGYGRRAREAAASARSIAPPRSSRAETRLALVVDATWAQVFSRGDEWIEAATELVELFPDEPQLLQQQALALGAAGRRNEALARIDRAVQLDPLNPVLRLARGGLLRRAERFDDSAEALDEAEALFELAKSDEGRAAVESARGALLGRQERQREAVEHFEHAAEIYLAGGRELSAAQAWLDVSGKLLEIGDTNAARERIDAALALGERLGNLKLQCDAYSARGILRYYGGDYEGAIADYREAIDRGRQLESPALLADPLANAAALLAWLGRAEEARPLLDEAIVVAEALGRGDMLQSARFSLSELAFREGDLDAAVAHNEALVASSDGEYARIPSFGYLGLGAIHRLRGSLGVALEQLELAVEAFQTLELPKELARALLNRAITRSALGRHESAAGDLDAAEEAGAEYPDILRDCAVARAALAAERGDWNEALQRINDLPDGGERPAAQLTACRARLARGESGDAERACAGILEHELASAADRVVASTFLARALLAGDRADEAERHAREALAGAERMGLLPQIADATALLLQLPEPLRPEDPTDLRRRGRAALQAILDASPEQDRAWLSASPRFRFAFSVLTEGDDPVGSRQERTKVRQGGGHAS
jgi:tetratricopeptide (TPR) repeat protein/tRNA A-37 threonylcarbamoyl transferase component Bud32